MASKGSKYDWEAIWRDYRAGVLSIREVSKKHGVDHSYLLRKAKKLGVNRDLTARVKKAVGTKLVTAGVTTPNATDDEIVEEESDKVVGVVQLHRKDIQSLRKLESGLIAELSGNPTKLYMTQYQGKIVQQVVELTAAERSQAANNLANVQHKRIQLERQAYNMNDQEDETANPLADFLNSLNGKSQGPPSER